MKRKVLISVLAIALVLTLCIGMFVACDPNEPTKYTVTYSLGDYDGTGTAPAAQEVEAGKTTTLPAVGVTWDDHTFLGWKAGEGETLQPGAEVEVNADITYTAQWQESGTFYTVKFDLNGYDGTEKAPADIRAKENSEITLPTISFKWGNKVLNKWELGKNSLEYRDPGSQYTVTADATFYAYWSEPGLKVSVYGTDGNKLGEETATKLDDSYYIYNPALEYELEAAEETYFAYQLYDPATKEKKGAFDYRNFQADGDISIIIVAESVGDPAEPLSGNWLGNYYLEHRNGKLSTIEIEARTIDIYLNSSDEELNPFGSIFQKSIWIKNGKYVVKEQHPVNPNEPKGEQTAPVYYSLALSTDGNSLELTNLTDPEESPYTFTRKPEYTVTVHYTLNGTEKTVTMQTESIPKSLDHKMTDPLSYDYDDNYDLVPVMEDTPALMEALKPGEYYAYYYYDADAADKKGDAFDCNRFEASANFDIIIIKESVGMPASSIDSAWYGNYESGGNKLTISGDDDGYISFELEESNEEGSVADQQIFQKDGKYILGLNYNTFVCYYFTKNADGSITMESEGAEAITFTKCKEITVTINYKIGAESKSTTANATYYSAEELYSFAEEPLFAAEDLCDTLTYGQRWSYYWYTNGQKGEEFDWQGFEAEGEVAILIEIETFATKAESIDPKFDGIFTGKNFMEDETISITIDSAKGTATIEFEYDPRVDGDLDYDNIYMMGEDTLVLVDGPVLYAKYYYFTCKDGKYTFTNSTISYDKDLEFKKVETYTFTGTANVGTEEDGKGVIKKIVLDSLTEPTKATVTYDIGETTDQEKEFDLIDDDISKLTGGPSGTLKHYYSGLKAVKIPLMFTFGIGIYEDGTVVVADKDGKYIATFQKEGAEQPAQEWTVTLNGADGYTKEVKVKDGEFLTLPEDFPMTQKYKDNTHTYSFHYFTKIREFDYTTTPITEDTRLTAVYHIKITYDLNGATQSEEAPLFEWIEDNSGYGDYYYGYNGDMTGLPTLEDLNASYEGFRFVGWKQSNTEEIKDAGSYKGANTTFYYDITFTAQWKEIKESYTITYKADGNDSFATQTVKHGEKTSAPTPAPTYNKDQSLYFAYWAIDGTENEFSFDTEIMEDYTLVAIYRHYFSFDIGDGAQGTAPAPQTFGKLGGSAKLPDSTGFSKSGQQLVGWTVKGDETNKIWRIGETYTTSKVDENITFDAKWMDDTKQVTLKFKSNEGATGTMEDVKVAPYSEYTLPEPTFQMKEGYISFEHWEYTDAAGEKKTIKAKESIKLNEETEIEFTAVYSDLITGSATGTLLHLHLATKTGDFNGFELSFTLEGSNITLTITFTPSDDKPVDQSVATAKGTIDTENKEVNIVIYYNYVAYEYGDAKAVNEITTPLSGYYTCSDTDSKFGFTTDGKLFAFDGEKTTQTTYYQVGQNQYIAQSKVSTSEYGKYNNYYYTFTLTDGKLTVDGSENAHDGEYTKSAEKQIAAGEYKNGGNYGTITIAEDWSFKLVNGTETYEGTYCQVDEKTYYVTCTYGEGSVFYSQFDLVATGVIKTGSTNPSKYGSENYVMADPDMTEFFGSAKIGDDEISRISINTMKEAGYAIMDYMYFGYSNRSNTLVLLAKSSLSKLDGTSKTETPTHLYNATYSTSSKFTLAVYKDGTVEVGDASGKFIATFMEQTSTTYIGEATVSAGLHNYKITKINIHTSVLAKEATVTYSIDGAAEKTETLTIVNNSSYAKFFTGENGDHEISYYYSYDGNGMAFVIAIYDDGTLMVGDNNDKYIATFKKEGGEEEPAKTVTITVKSGANGAEDYSATVTLTAGSHKLSEIVDALNTQNKAPQGKNQFWYFASKFCIGEDGKNSNFTSDSYDFQTDVTLFAQFNDRTWYLGVTSPGSYPQFYAASGFGNETGTIAFYLNEADEGKGGTTFNYTYDLSKNIITLTLNDTSFVGTFGKTTVASQHFCEINIDIKIKDTPYSFGTGSPVKITYKAGDKATGADYVEYVAKSSNTYDLGTIIKSFEDYGFEISDDLYYFTYFTDKDGKKYTFGNSSGDITNRITPSSDIELTAQYAAAYMATSDDFMKYLTLDFYAKTSELAVYGDGEDPELQLSGTLAITDRKNADGVKFTVTFEGKGTFEGIFHGTNEEGLADVDITITIDGTAYTFGKGSAQA